MRIEKIPLTLNGKVDKSALPEPVLDGVVIVPASDPTQEKLLEIVKDILKTDMIGIRTDLFEMGLSSLGAIRLCSMIRENFGAIIKTSELNDEVTVEGLEQLIATHKDTADYSVREEYPLSMTQMGIYIEQELHKDTTIYNIPSLYKLGDNVDIRKLTEAVTAHKTYDMTIFHHRVIAVVVFLHSPLDVGQQITDTVEHHQCRMKLFYSSLEQPQTFLVMEAADIEDVEVCRFRGFRAPR